MQLRRVLVIAVALGVALVPVAASASSGWQIASTPNPGGTGALSFNVFKGVSCTSAASCIAVGVYGGLTTSAGDAFAASWDGVSWQTQAAVIPAAQYSELDGIKCVSSAFCTAVGFSEDLNTGLMSALAEEWNGTTWSIEQIPNPAGVVLNAVACTTSANCIAVGYEGTPVPWAEHWNGSSWTAQAVPAIKDGKLTGVSCTSASACTAVGSAGPTGLALRWNGSSWKTQTVAVPTGAVNVLLNGVKCSSGTSCTAVGSAEYQVGEKTLAERWNGTSWKVQATPSPNTFSVPAVHLTAVSCISASSCTAVGASENDTPVSSVVIHWNGTTWKVQPSPNGPNSTDSRLLGVSCTTNCTAVGEDDFDGGSAPEFTLAMHN